MEQNTGVRIDFEKLREPFFSQDIEWRLQSCGTNKSGNLYGICLAYVSNRAIQTRLDEVCGPANWKNIFEKGPDGGIVCGISIKCGDEWITKWDGAENTKVEAIKGGLSDSMKRAAVQWGIGRYLYKLEEGFAVISDKGRYFGKTKDGDQFRWNPPTLPDWAIPKSELEERKVFKQKTEPEETCKKKSDNGLTLKQMIEKVRGYIDHKMLQDNWITTAESYIASENKDGLERVINYIEEQVSNCINAETSA